MIVYIYIVSILLAHLVETGAPIVHPPTGYMITK